MKTLSDVLRNADPLQTETRAPEARAVTRASALHGPEHYDYDIKTVSRRHVLAVVSGFAAALVATATGVFAWRHGFVDAIAAMRFEARIEGSDEVIVDTHDILTARAASLHDRGPGGSTKSSFGIALTFTAEGAEKMRRATRAHIGEHLELMIDGKVIMAPVIRDVISSSAMLTGDYTPAEAERIAQGLLKGKLEE